VQLCEFSPTTDDQSRFCLLVRRSIVNYSDRVPGFWEPVPCTQWPYSKINSEHSERPESSSERVKMAWLCVRKLIPSARSVLRTNFRIRPIETIIEIVWSVEISWKHYSLRHTRNTWPLTGVHGYMASRVAPCDSRKSSVNNSNSPLLIPICSLGLRRPFIWPHIHLLISTAFSSCGPCETFAVTL
jgi:hypothetical protein